MRSVTAFSLLLSFAAAIVMQELPADGAPARPADSVDVCSSAEPYVHLQIDDQQHLHCSASQQPELRAHLFDVGHITLTLQRFENGEWLLQKLYRDDAVENLRTRDAVVIHKIYHENDVGRFAPLVSAYLIAAAGCLALCYFLDLSWVMRVVSEV